VLKHPQILHVELHFNGLNYFEFEFKHLSFILFDNFVDFLQIQFQLGLISSFHFNQQFQFQEGIDA